jgi:hypothetical protein
LSLRAPKTGLAEPRQPSYSIRELVSRLGFARKIEDVREADFRLANRRLQRLGHLTVIDSARRSCPTPHEYSTAEGGTLASIKDACLIMRAPPADVVEFGHVQA